jgi:lysyl-tRNA synthetase class II
MRVEEEYMDVLHNMEFAIIEVYKAYPDLSDYDVIRALEVLIDNYSGERIDRPPREFRLTISEQVLVDTVRMMCDMHLGRITSEDDEESLTGPIEPVTVDEIILCLKRLIKSAKMWNKEGGRQGYLNFIAQYVY